MKEKDEMKSKIKEMGTWEINLTSNFIVHNLICLGIFVTDLFIDCLVYFKLRRKSVGNMQEISLIVHKMGDDG